MNQSRRISNALKILALTGAFAALSACSTLTLGEQRETESQPLKGNTASDYAILSCGELAVIETSARQRLQKLPANGENSTGDAVLLRAQIDEMVTNREALGCPVPRAAQLAGEAVTQTPTVVASKPIGASKPVAKPVVAPTQPASASGRFLQIGTFADASNAQAAANYFAERGFRAETRLTNTDGRNNHRVLIGPLSTDQDLSRASNAARSYGLNDAFLTDG